MRDYVEDLLKIFSDPERYKEWYERHATIYEDEKALVRSFHPKDCLDLGSGPAIFHEVLDGETVSIDVSEPMLRSFQGDRVLGDVRALPFRDRSFKCTFSAVTVCFVDDIESFFREMSRVTRERAIVCFIPLDSAWGSFYVELGKRGHRYYSKAIFRPKDEILGVFSKYFEIREVRSTLSFGPLEEARQESPTEGTVGSFICVSGPPLIEPAARLSGGDLPDR
jgi:ubiquinone/menaquinone biosynthesis C-methylase UbiE